MVQKMDLDEFMNLLMGDSDKALRRMDALTTLSDSLAVGINSLLQKGFTRLDVTMYLAETVAAMLGKLAVECADDAANHDEMCTASICMGISVMFLNGLDRSARHHVLEDKDDGPVRDMVDPVPPGAHVVSKPYRIYVNEGLASNKMRCFSHIDAAKTMPPEDTYEILVPVGQNKLHIECCPVCAGQGMELVDITGIRLRFMDFKDHDAVVRYTETGICQKCQDEENEHSST